MRVRHCPRCGSDDVDSTFYSAEYASSTQYRCQDCDWGYKDGRGIGVASRSSGTHPRKLNKKDQGELTETGEWCYDCETVAKKGRCRCVNDGDTAYCNDCADFEPIDKDTLLEVRRTTRAECDICDDNKAEYKQPRG